MPYRVPPHPDFRRARKMLSSGSAGFVLVMKCCHLTEHQVKDLALRLQRERWDEFTGRAGRTMVDRQGVRQRVHRAPNAAAGR
jgi:hypothetical protein